MGDLILLGDGQERLDALPGPFWLVALVVLHEAVAFLVPPVSFAREELRAAVSTLIKQHPTLQLVFVCDRHVPVEEITVHVEEKGQAFAAHPAVQLCLHIQSVPHTQRGEA